MTAYAHLQFSEIPETEREQVKAALLKYCELDTLAMVMIMEEWLECSIQKEDNGFLQIVIPPALWNFFFSIHLANPSYGFFIC